MDSLITKNVLTNNFLSLIKSSLNFNIKTRDLSKIELIKQELHVKIQNQKIEILRRHKTQDDLRISFFINFLTNSLNLLNEKIDCEFIVNLDESVECEQEINKFCYARKKSTNGILIPDAHNFVTFEKIKSLGMVDIPFDQKDNKGIFIGSATGNLKDGHVMRSLFCNRYLNNKNTIAKLIGDIRQEIIDNLIDYSSTHSSFIDIKDQLKNKIIISIDGNSTSWERPLWAMASNSICVYIEPYEEYRYESWFYPIMDSLCVMPKISLENYEFFMENDFENAFWQQINENQKVFANFIGDISNQYIYFANILFNYNLQYNLV